MVNNPSKIKSIKNSPEIQKQISEINPRICTESNAPITPIINPIPKKIPARPRDLPASSKLVGFTTFSCLKLFNIRFSAEL